MPERPHPLPVPAATAQRALWPVTTLVVLLGIGAEVGEYYLGLSERVVETFSLSYEANLPTWYASALLLGCAGVLAAIAHAQAGRGAPDRRHWAALSALFLYISIDETVEIHEHATFFDTSGVLYFSWVIPAAILVGALGLVFLPFVRRLESTSRRAFLLAGFLYVGGALGMELPLGWWTELHGDHNFVYGLIDWMEESLELSGTTLFFCALWAHHDRLSGRTP